VHRTPGQAVLDTQGKKYINFNRVYFLHETTVRNSS
jgi:hypothetical protein